jgi:hypothetical protein
MWDRVTTTNMRALADRRDTELKSTYWHQLIAHGAGVARLYKTENSALKILDIVHARATGPHIKLLLQEELVDQGLYLSETQAGQTLHNSLQNVYATQMQTLRQLSEQARTANPQLAKQLDKELKKARADLNKTFEDMRRMQIPLGRRFMSFFRKHTIAVILLSVCYVGF